MNQLDRYAQLPVPLQNVATTAYGLRQLPLRHGGKYRRYCDELERRQWWPAEKLQQEQDRRVTAMATWCAARIPYYRDLFREIGIEAGDLTTAEHLRALPILDKETVRSEPHRFRPDPPIRAIAQTTGGTTGTPLRYWASPQAVKFNYATYEVRTRRWAGVKLGDPMVALHGQPIVPPEQGAPPYWRRNLAFNQLYCSVYHLGDATLPAYVEAISSFAPRVVVGYTSAVHRIARYLIETGDVGRITPVAVLVSSETLTPAARDDMTTAFGCRVTNSYSLGELVAYVSECEHGELHISPEYGAIELLPGQAPKPDGGGHEILATGLTNLAMPLLRYRTGDLASPAPGPAKAGVCGRSLPMLDSLTGRADDVVHTPEGNTIGPAPMSLAFQQVPNLRHAQVHQDDPASVHILLEPGPGFSSTDQEQLERELRRRLGQQVRLDFEQVQQIPRTSGGKERFIVSSLGEQ